MTNDEWQTPDWLMRIFAKWFDPCPGGERLFDGLEVSWGPRTYVNPPYSNPLPWVKKAISERDQRGGPVVLLLPHDSSTEWWRLLHEAGARFLCIVGRAQFEPMTDRARWASVLVVLS